MSPAKCMTFSLGQKLGIAHVTRPELNLQATGTRHSYILKSPANTDMHAHDVWQDLTLPACFRSPAPRWKAIDVEPGLLFICTDGVTAANRKDSTPTGHHGAH